MRGLDMVVIMAPCVLRCSLRDQAALSFSHPVGRRHDGGVRGWVWGC